jgi:hypothetical protein
MDLNWVKFFACFCVCEIIDAWICVSILGKINVLVSKVLYFLCSLYYCNYRELFGVESLQYKNHCKENLSENLEFNKRKNDQNG